MHTKDSLNHLDGASKEGTTQPRRPIRFRVSTGARGREHEQHHDDASKEPATATNTERGLDGEDLGFVAWSADGTATAS